MISQLSKLTPDVKEFWSEQIAEFLATNDGKMELADLELPPLDHHGGLGKFCQVFGEHDYKQMFANIVAQENTKRTGEPWVVFNYCEGGAYRPSFLQTPTAMRFTEADKFIRCYEPKVREMNDGCYDKLEYAVYYKRSDGEVCSAKDRYDLGDSKKVSGLYNVIKAETDYYYAHPEVYKSMELGSDIAADRERDYADIAILKRAVTTEYPYVEIEKVIRYASGDKLDQRIFNKGEVLSFAEAESKIKREEKIIYERNIKEYGATRNGDEELGIAVHFRLLGESEPRVFRVSYLLGDYDEKQGGLLNHFKMGMRYYNLCVKNGDYHNINTMLGGETANDAIRLASEYTNMYETLRDSMTEAQAGAIEIQSSSVCMMPPDLAISITDMLKYGYTATELLPLTKERALELFEKGKAIYLLYSDNTEVMAFERSDIEQFDGIFGIDKVDWEKVRISDKEECERSLEAYFLGNNNRLEPSLPLTNGIPPITTQENIFGIYQVRDDIENILDVRYATLDELKQCCLEPTRDNYRLVYVAHLTERIEFLADRQPILNALYQRFNINHPKDFTGRSMSVSDVVVLRYGGDMSVYYVDSIGFVEISKSVFYK